MGIEFRELWLWARNRKLLASFLVTITLCLGILIGTLISGRAMATRAQAPNGASLLAIPDPVSLSKRFFEHFEKPGPCGGEYFHDASD